MATAAPTWRATPPPVSPPRSRPSSPPRRPRSPPPLRAFSALVSPPPSQPRRSLSAALSALHASFLAKWRAAHADLSAAAPGAAGVAACLTARRLAVANVGDARAVLVRGRRAVRLSEEHKPYDGDEAARVAARGGQVVGDGHTAYVERRLALSRSIGDFRAPASPPRLPSRSADLAPAVVCEPHATEIELTEADTHLILACDGLWDVCSEAHAARVCRHAPDAATAAARLRDLAFDLGSDDNVRATLPHSPSHSPSLTPPSRQISVLVAALPAVP